MILDVSQNSFYMVFETDDEGGVSLRHFSTQEKEWECASPKNLRGCRIVDIHVAGEDTADHHGYKHTGSSRTKLLKYVTHRYFENEYGNQLEFDLADDSLAVTVHEMAKDEARHGRAFKGLLERYFG